MFYGALGDVIDTVNRNYALEQQQRALEREIRWYKRLEAGTLDDMKKQAYTDRRKLAQAKLRDFINENSDVLRRDLWRERLVNTVENGIIKIEIDELTPCLRRLHDGKIVRTEIVKIKPTKKEFKDWEFDWTIPEKQGFSVYGILAEDDNRIQGLVAMRADPRSYAYHIDIVEAAPFNSPHNPKFKKKEYSGVGGHLFAEAVRRSLEDGFGGAVYFFAKSDLIEYYSKELGAVLTNPRLRIMFIDEDAAVKLYNRYYGGE